MLLAGLGVRAVVAGRVVRFDPSRGYGFIAPQQGGEDVFLHVNDMLIPESQVRTGLAVEFEIEEGERGPKASAVRLADDAVPMDGDNLLCDVLSAKEYTREVTEVLLEGVPSLTGEQIVAIRRVLVNVAKRHGWTEN
ncbi:cold shock domain-containing protein [Streptomyces sp. KK5PA1]|uniref:Cold shock domain-containing protein n=1 Tax=Actinacidiphila acididurans TaxID=2784346 RepID=A0ABS2TJY2_9ACTN|nr:cold shock domain-containing protein [Actinacidiphila acididurans]